MSINIGSIVKSETAEVSLTDIGVESTDLIPCRERDGWLFWTVNSVRLRENSLVSHLIGGIGLDELTQIEVIVVNSLGQSIAKLSIVELVNLAIDENGLLVLLGDEIVLVEIWRQIMWWVNTLTEPVRILKECLLNDEHGLHSFGVGLHKLLIS